MISLGGPVLCPCGIPISVTGITNAWHRSNGSYKACAWSDLTLTVLSTSKLSRGYTKQSKGKHHWGYRKFFFERQDCHHWQLKCWQNSWIAEKSIWLFRCSGFSCEKLKFAVVTSDVIWGKDVYSTRIVMGADCVHLGYMEYLRIIISLIYVLKALKPKKKTAPLTPRIFPSPNESGRITCALLCNYE